MRTNQIKQAKDIINMVAVARAELQRLELEQPHNDKRRFELTNLICILKTEALDLMTECVNNSENKNVVLKAA